MEGFTLIRFIVGVVFTLLLLIFVYQKTASNKNALTTKFIVRSGIFAAISIILYIIPYFNLALPIFPGFLKIHFDEIPALIAGFAYGPLSGVIIVLVKTLVKLPLTSTMGVGELADFIYSIAFIVPAALIYRYKRNIPGALIGLLVGTVVQLLTSTFITTFAILNFYIFMMGWSEDRILAMCQAVNPMITNLRWPFFFLVALPFNALKDVLVVIITFLLYKKMHGLIDKIGAQKN